MKKLTDQEIQELLEKGLSPADASSPEQADLKTYQLLFEELGKEIPEGLPLGFSARVAARLQSQQQTRGVTFYILAVLFAIIGLGALSIVAFLIKANLAELVGALSEYKWIVVFGLLILIAIQYFDQKLIRNHAGI